MVNRFQNNLMQRRSVPSSYDWTNADILTLIALICLLIVRLFAIFVTPLELGVDEAQYWVWSQDLSLGYYSKPPLIAWIIWAAHAVIGHSSFGVRIFAPIIHFLITLILWKCACQLYGDSSRAPRIGRITALLWALMPAVSLGSSVMSTDTPMLLFWCLALYLIIPSNSVTYLSARNYLLTGFIIGFALLSKYAAGYFLICAGLWLMSAHVSSYSKRFLCFVTLTIGSIIILFPNLVWNFNNGLVTIMHLSENANINEPSYSFIELKKFWEAQFFVFGPLSLIFFFAGIFKWEKHSLFLLCFSVPILLIISIQAYIKEANANWAVAAYPAATLLVAGWLGNFSKQTLSAITIFVNSVISITVISVVITGHLGQLTPESDPLRRVRGWHALSTDLGMQIDLNNARTIIADRRATAAILKWYFFNEPVNITVYDEDKKPSNHFELKYSYNSEFPSPIITITTEQIEPSIAGIKWNGLIGTSNHQIARDKYRNYYFYLGRN